MAAITEFIEGEKVVKVWYTTAMNNSYFQTPEFRRASRNATDTGLKLVFRFISDVGMGIFKFIQSMVRMVIGK